MLKRLNRIYKRLFQFNTFNEWLLQCFVVALVCSLQPLYSTPPTPSIILSQPTIRNPSVYCLKSLQFILNSEKCLSKTRYTYLQFLTCVQFIHFIRYTQHIYTSDMRRNKHNIQTYYRTINCSLRTSCIMCLGHATSCSLKATIKSLHIV